MFRCDPFWFLIAILFLVLALWHFTQSGMEIPPFPTPDRPRASGGHAEFFGMPLDQPIKDFVAEFNLYLGEQNNRNRNANLMAAAGYFIAFLAALLSGFREGRMWGTRD